MLCFTERGCAGNMDSKLNISLLYDFYGELLQASQQRVVELYVNDDLSLSEVADILGISRQGVRDSLGRAERKLKEYEHKLGLAAAHADRRDRNAQIADRLGAIRDLTDNGAIHALLDEIARSLQKEE